MAEISFREHVRSYIESRFAVSGEEEELRESLEEMTKDELIQRCIDMEKENSVEGRISELLDRAAIEIFYDNYEWHKGGDMQIPGDLDKVLRWLYETEYKISLESRCERDDCHVCDSSDRSKLDIPR